MLCCCRRCCYCWCCSRRSVSGCEKPDKPVQEHLDVVLDELIELTEHASLSVEWRLAACFCCWNVELCTNATNLLFRLFIASTSPTNVDWCCCCCSGCCVGSGGIMSLSARLAVEWRDSFSLLTTMARTKSKNWKLKQPNQFECVRKHIFQSFCLKIYET